MIDVKIDYEYYLSNFLEENNINGGLRLGYQTMVKRISLFEKPIIEWNNYDLDVLLKQTGSISVNSITKYIQMFRTFYVHVCKKEGIEKPRPIFATHSEKYYIDYNKLMSVTINTMQYKALKEMFSYYESGKTYNTRDKLIFELYWEGFTADEIRKIKKSDIEFSERLGYKYVEIKLGNRIKIIDNIEVIEDIKLTMNEFDYLLLGREGRKDSVRKLKDSKYLIRPIQTNNSKVDYISNPSAIIKRYLSRLNISFEGKDLEAMAPEDIKRSRVIEMLKNPAVDKEDVKEFLGKKAMGDLYWIEDFAQIMKHKEDAEKAKRDK